MYLFRLAMDWIKRMTHLNLLLLGTGLVLGFFIWGKNIFINFDQRWVRVYVYIQVVINWYALPRL